jgi:predicted metalloprotease
MKERSGDVARANALQVRMEQQADCLTGVWASLNNMVKSLLEPGDIEEALQAAAAIGDDNLQRQTQGSVVPESFTHGTSAQRVRWFREVYAQSREGMIKRQSQELFEHEVHAPQQSAGPRRCSRRAKPPSFR